MDNDGELAIKKVAGGVSILFLGVIFSRFFSFIYRMIIARYLGPENYGVLSIGLAILSILVPLSIFGIPAGVTRYVSYFRSKKEIRKIKGVLNFSMKLATISGLFFGLLLFFLSNWLANNFFHTPSLTIILKIFSISLPFFTINRIMQAAIRGFQQMKYRVYSEIFISKLILLIATLIFLLFDFGIFGASMAYVFSIIAFFIASGYFLNKIFPFFKKVKSICVTKELLHFSWPLIFSTIIWVFVGHLDVLMLGHFDTALNVGIYNAAFPIAVLLSIVIGSFGIIFLPVSTELFAKENTNDLNLLFIIVTKWVYLLVLPGFLLIFFFSNPLLKVLFGPEYVKGALSLSILVIGYFIASIVGPTLQMLQTLGKTRIILLNHSIVLITNIFLNLYLIPIYSIVGAAIATTIAISLWNLLSLFEVYHYTKIQPYHLNYLKPTTASLIAIGVIFVLRSFITHYSMLLLLGLLLLFFVLYFTLFLLFKSLEKEDIMILLALEKKLGLDLKFFKKIIKRFI